MQTLSLFLLSASAVSAYPWVANQPGVDSTLLPRNRNVKRQSSNTGYDYAPGTCPFNANHQPAAPYNSKYPYTGARNGAPGSGKGGILVPADGDTAHAFQAPGPNDIRGPCPGLNAAANHNFLARDGITTFNELVDAQQNVYNVGHDLATLLATLGILADGDILTEKLSIGCDATSRTATLGGALGKQPGLAGHNKFEADSSLTRNDYFTHNGNDYSFNGTLFGRMKDTADRVSGGNFDRNTLAAYRSQRYDESVQENPNFFFGPLALLLYGASSFLYELFPNFGNEGTPDLKTISSFFGTYQDSNGQWQAGPERIPDKWYSRRTPYTNNDVTLEILAQYVQYPKLFGGNVGTNNFDALSTPFGIITDGKLPSAATASDILCLLYQLGTQAVPSSLSVVTDIPLSLLNWSAGKLNPVFKNAGCQLRPDQTAPST
jgi:hypothetical protein